MCVTSSLSLNTPAKKKKKILCVFKSFCGFHYKVSTCLLLHLFLSIPKYAIHFVFIVNAISFSVCFSAGYY